MLHNFFFFISNSLSGWLGKDLIKLLSVCFLFKSISLRKDPTIGFSAIKHRQIFKNKLKRILSFQNTLADRIKILPKASIINSVSCHIMIYVCLNTLCEVWRSKNIFLYVIFWKIRVICYLRKKIRATKLSMLSAIFL